MPDLLPRMPPKGPLTPERRQSPRHPVRPTEYIEIGDSNGGIILDISAGGMAVASAHALVGNQTLLFRFQLPRSLEIIEASGEINWIGETKKRAGVRFVDLPPAAREQIQRWIDSQISGRFDDHQKPNISPISPPSPRIPQGLPRHEPAYHEFAEEETAVPYGHNSKNLNPFSSALSGPLDEPEIDESEPAEEEKRPADSDDQPPPERRIQSRLPMTASTYVQLSNGNGGLMANLSKTGFCVRAAKTLETDELPVVRFQLPDAPDFVESSAWIVWKSPSRKTVGARFESLSDEAQSQIAQWIDSQPLPKNASVKNPLSKDPQNPAASSPSEQRQKISPAPKTPAPVTPVPVTLMSPDSVPIPAYISPLAISLDAQPAVPSANNSSSTLSRPKTPSIAPSGKPSLPSTGKTPAQVPPVSSASSSAKPAPQSQRPLAVPRSKPLAPAASSTNAPNLHSPLPIEPSPLISRGLKNSWDQFAAAPPPTGPFVPLVFNEPDWSVAPKRPTGYWKTAAMIVVIVGTLLGATTFLRSKKSATPLSQETAQNYSAATSAPVITSPDPAATSAVTNEEPINQPTPSTASRSNSAPSREFSDAPRNITPSKGLPKGDEQFVDEPRPARSQSQVLSSATQSNNPESRTAGDQPSSSGPAAIQSEEHPTEESAGFPTIVRRVPTSPTPGSSNVNGEAAATTGSASPPPVTAVSRDQQGGTNLASAAGVTQNSSSPTRVAATPENNSLSRTTVPSTTPSPATSTAAQASSTANISNPVPPVSVFSRFRSIRNTSDTARPAGSDLQIGRLKSGPTPPYPIEALRQQIQGTVELDVLVGADGSILTVHLVKGPPELASVAMSTVRSWQYGQTTLGGRPVETDQSIYFTFRLTK
jgi:outer membrane biosynthesis protein TonB